MKINFPLHYNFICTFSSELSSCVWLRMTDNEHDDDDIADDSLEQSAHTQLKMNANKIKCEKYLNWNRFYWSGVVFIWIVSF